MKKQTVLETVREKRLQRLLGREDLRNGDFEKSHWFLEGQWEIWEDVVIK